MSDNLPSTGIGATPGAPAPWGSTSGEAMTAEQQRRVRRPMVLGAAFVGVFVVGALIWAAVFSIKGGVVAPGSVRPEDNRQTVKHLEGGVVRDILVRDGQFVRQGETLMVFDDTTARAQVDVLRGGYLALLAQRARLEAELMGRDSIAFPAELTQAAASDPRAAQMIRDQQILFSTRNNVFRSELAVLGQRELQLAQRQQGLQAQINSTESQSALIGDELEGIQSLYERGYAPKSRVAALQRNQAQLLGERGARMAEVAGTAEALGENRIRMAEVRQRRANEAADELKTIQQQLAEVTPRLRAAEATLARTVVKAPSTGRVFGLTQFTLGGVAAPGERLLDVVPESSPLIVAVRVPPDRIDEIRVGMPAQVRLTAYNSRSVPPVAAEVTKVGADLVQPEQGAPFFQAELRVDPAELKKLGSKVQLTPGMPADGMIVTGNRSILDYVMAPFTDTLRDSLREP
jgi:HlyD family type I secretion membrane fusion protein